MKKEDEIEIKVNANIIGRVGATVSACLIEIMHHLHTRAKCFKE